MCGVIFMCYYFLGVYSFACATGFIAQFFSNARTNATVQRNTFNIQLHNKKTYVRRSIQTSYRSELSFELNINQLKVHNTIMHI